MFARCLAISLLCCPSERNFCRSSSTNANIAALRCGRAETRHFVLSLLHFCKTANTGRADRLIASFEYKHEGGKCMLKISKGHGIDSRPFRMTRSLLWTPPLNNITGYCRQSSTVLIGTQVYQGVKRLEALIK